MKSILKASIKILVFFFALTLVNCEKNDEFRENNSQTENTNNLTIKRVTLNGVKEDNDLHNVISKINKFLDVNKVKSTNSRIDATDNSFTILTDEILEATTNNSKAYTFRTETPIHPEATFENFVLERRGEQENFHIYIYSYKTIVFSDNSEYTFIFFVQELDQSIINIEDFENFTNASMAMIDSCLYEVNQGGDPIGEPIWCFGSDGSGSSTTSTSTSSSNGDTVIFKPNGEGSCTKYIHTTGPWGFEVVQIEYNVACQGNSNNTDSNNNGNDGADEDNNDNTDNVNDPHFNDDPISTGPSGGSQTNNNNTSTVGALPPKNIDYQQKITDCLSPDFNTQTWMQNTDNNQNIFLLLEI